MQAPHAYALKSCLLKTRNFVKNRTIFNSRDKLLPVYNMASSGLTEMLILTILFTHKCVSENVCPVILLWTTYFLIILMAVFYVMLLYRQMVCLGRCYCLRMLW